MARAGEVLAQMRRLPFADLDQITHGRQVMVLAPHPDDESLGCGGLIARLCAAGHPPIVTILTDGTGSHPGSRSYPPRRLRRLRECEAGRAVQILGMASKRLHFLRFRDTAAPTAGVEFDRAVELLLDLMRTYDCQVLCAPWLHEPHGDHEAAQIIARAVSRANHSTLLSYIVWGWTLPADTILPDEPTTGWRLDITECIARKRRAIAEHASQHGNLIKDVPDDFHLPDQLLTAATDCHYEVLLSSHEQ